MNKPFWVAAFFLALVVGDWLHAQEEVQSVNEDGSTQRLIETAESLFRSGDRDRSLQILQSFLEQYPESPLRYQARLLLGACLVKNGKYQEALSHLKAVTALDAQNNASETQKKWIQEALLLTGKAYYETHQYELAFPVLRKLVRDGESSWSNQAYYYIGMCHFAQGNWQKAVEAFALVGTFAEPADGQGLSVEIGRRLYIKVNDADLPATMRIGKPVEIRVVTQFGDEERLQCLPVNANGETFLSSIATQTGVPVKGDGKLSLTSGDVVTVEYIDENVREGKGGIKRLVTIPAVSSGGLEFTQATYEAPAEAAFLEQPVFLVLRDADLDVSERAEAVEVRVMSRYKVSDSTGENDQEPSYQLRDEVTVRLKELGVAPVRSGRFTGRLWLSSEKKEGKDGMPVLHAMGGDEISAVYVDERHGNGDVPRKVIASLPASGALDGRPQATQFVVSDPRIRAEKNLVEASAFLELGRIFQKMGLTQGAVEKCDKGLDLVREVIKIRKEIPARLQEDLLQIKWNLEIAKGDYAAAVATCLKFSKQFPESPKVGDALLGIAKIKLEKGEFSDAMQVFQQVLALPSSPSKAEAQFLSARAAELRDPENKEAGLPFYRLTLEKYPESEFVGPSLGKIIDAAIESRDYLQAEDWLRQAFQDHPDARFLDALLMKWIVMAHRKHDLSTVRDKCRQLMIDYPDSRFVPRVREILGKIEEPLKSSDS